MATSFQPNNSQNPLFSKSKQVAPSFILALLFAFVLMVTDCHFRSFGYLRSGFSLLVAPLQYAVDYPVRIAGWLRLLVSTKKALIDQNMRLQYQQMMLEAELQKFMLIRNENSQLKALLSAASPANIRTMAAQIIAVETSNSRQLLILNKGSRDGVFEGQPILDAKGVMGQIIDVGLVTSTVLLISDAKCAVPVRNDRTGERAILVGTNNISQLSLINLPKSSSIEKGDLLVTSGLGRRYPEGYPVGRVETIQNSPGDDFIRVGVRPIAQLNRSRLVLLLWPEREHDLLTAQINERLNIIEAHA